VSFSGICKAADAWKPREKRDGWLERVWGPETGTWLEPRQAAAPIRVEAAPQVIPRAAFSPDKVVGRNGRLLLCLAAEVKSRETARAPAMVLGGPGKNCGLWGPRVCSDTEVSAHDRVRKR